MKEHCSEWSPNDHILQSPISTVCLSILRRFLGNISIHTFARLFTTDLIAKECARQTLRDVMLGPDTAEEAHANYIQKQESRLYSNDDLTRSRSELLFECRQAQKKQLIADCWSYDCSIIVKTITHTIGPSKHYPILIRSVCIQ